MQNTVTVNPLFRPGDHVGRYRVEAFLGQGAFAQVYQVTHLGLNAPRAVKVLRRDMPGVGSSDYHDCLLRFQLEAQLGAQLDHPHIIRVYDFEQIDNALLLVMEYVPGGSLADCLKARGSLPVSDALRLACELAEGLAALHALDIVHRDFKPSNILFDAQGHAKVADLGLAQIPHGPSGRSQQSTPLPHPGTPAYMSPEQRDTREHLTPASDIYALGAVLFEVLTGRVYRGQRPGTDARALRPDVPASTAALLARMLAKDPEARPWGGAEAAPLLQAEEAAYRQWVAEQAARQQREATEDARKQREAEAAARKQREAEEAALKQREAEESARKQREAEAAARKQREAEEAARKQREAEEAARKQREAEEAAGKQRKAEMDRKRRENTLPLTLAPGLEMFFVHIPAGSFMMGTTREWDVWSCPDERPLHTVDLSPYWIGQDPVTNTQYAAFVQATGHRAPKHWQEGKIPAGIEQHPVVNVSWHDAVAFCQWTFETTGWGVRLPTEAEWEKAARGTDGRLFPWGNDWPDDHRCNYSSNENATTPPGTYSPHGDSPYGCADLSGNVLEWCMDWYDEDYYQNTPRSNPAGPARGTYRVLRGGSWQSNKSDVRGGYRYRLDPNAANDYCGFRCFLFESPEERQRREAEEAARKQREVEEAARKQREAEEAAACKQREAEEAAARKQRQAEELARKQREAEEAVRKQEAEEAARKQMMFALVHLSTQIPKVGDTWTRPRDGMVMVYVPMGEFKMGSEDGGEREKPVHTVALDAFWIDRTEVTNAQYQKCVQAGVCVAPEYAPWENNTDYNADSQPVVGVDWHNAKAYCEWVGGQLPTEAQWEYAARGPENRVYPWGAQAPTGDLVNSYYACFEKPATVGNYPAGASWVGALDMSGNVWEWMSDWEGPYTSARQENPTGPPRGEYKIVRGGLWDGYDGGERLVCAASRSENEPTARVSVLGFRCVWEATGATHKQREAEETSRKQREVEATTRAEEAARKQREAEEAVRKQREAEEAARKQREAEEAARKQREVEAAARAEEAVRKRRVAARQRNVILAGAVFLTFLVFGGGMLLRGFSAAQLGDTWTRPTDGMVMIYVPAGEFQMGNEDGDSDEEPVHTVGLNAFWIDQTEVTNAQYEKCVQAGLCVAPAYKDNTARNGTTLPVVGVDWNQAKAYCAWVGGQLPTEAQWEYAARGPESWVYPWGDEAPTCSLANYGDCVGKPVAVGSYPAGVSWVGALDMAGNVWEWTKDWYGAYTSRRQKTPTGPSSGEDKMIRGGAWLWHEWCVRTTERGRFAPTSRVDFVGFRCVAARQN